MPHHFNIAEKLEEDFLQGRPLGRKHFPLLCALATSLTTGEVVLIDFCSVKMVTGSWINEALVPLLSWMADQRNNLFPVIVNFNDEWLDELQLVAEWTHTCFLVSNSEVSNLPMQARIAGRLDVGQRETLKAVVLASSVTGAELERFQPEAGVKATAWNNRLKDLYSKRILRRQKRGREQVYSPVVSEILIDG